MAFATVYNDVRRPSHPFLRPPVEADEIGRLGSYRVLRLLGQGGMGFVFHAEDAALRRPVALKVMRPELDQDEDGLERFLREARLMASIKHDHLVTVYQVGQEGRLPYLAMELLQGESLDHWMKQSRKVSVSDVLRLSREIVSGLAVIHRHGLIHRDVKPANIWLEKPGAGQDPRLRAGPRRQGRGPADAARHGPGHARLHGAGAGPRRNGGRPRRPVQRRLHPLRAVERTRPLRGPDHDGRADRAGRERSSTPPRTPFFVAARPVGPHHAAADEEPPRRPESAQVVLARLRKIEARLAARPASVSASATRREPPPRPKRGPA